MEAALHHSSHEITKAVLKAFMEPFWELERQGLLSNVLVVLFGSSVAADRRPNDIDVLIVANLDENAYVTKMNQLSPSADARMMEMLFSGGGEFNLTGMLHGWFPKGLHYQFLTEKEVLKTFDETTCYTDKTEWLKTAVADGAILVYGENTIDSRGKRIFRHVDLEFLG